MQQKDAAELEGLETKVVTKRPPTQQEMAAMLFGWRVVKHVKSNAIVYAGADRTLGIGAGQMSRVDASRIAVWKAAEAGLSLKGSAVASDAFFPFADGLIAAAEAGATGRDSAGRFGARRRSDRRRRRAQDGDGLHRRPAFPALSYEALPNESCKPASRRNIAACTKIPKSASATTSTVVPVLGK